LPRRGRSAYELFDSLGRPGGVRGLLVMGSNVVVASPHAGNVEARLRALDVLVVCDAFLNETAMLAHVVLPVMQWAEEEGTLTNFEGRVIRRRAAALPPPGVRGDIDVLRELARRLGCGEKFDFDGPREVFEEFRQATAGGVADYAGITYDRIDREKGVFWPCPSEDHPGTPRLFEEGAWNPVARGAGRFYFPDGKARFNVAPYSPPAEDVDDDYPVILTTGRVVSQFLSGTQTRRIGPLVDQYPEPRIEMHPRLAAKLGLADGDWATVESRRGDCTLRVQVVTTIRPDTVFVPYHWGGARSVNQVTIAAQDPISKIPEFKVCAVRVRKAAAPAYAAAYEPQQ
jgi:assimilatory nitrate reductase catalytic subunit